MTELSATTRAAIGTSPYADLCLDATAMPARLNALMSSARTDLSLARMLEGHIDAISILTEAGLVPEKSQLHGIWASGGQQSTLKLQRSAAGWLLHGSKPFCSGSDLVDTALIHLDDSKQLVRVDMCAARRCGKVSCSSQWTAGAFADTHTATVSFERYPIGSGADLIGDSGWYFSRAGFWQGALAPAACWAGGATALVDYVNERQPASPHHRAHLGAMIAEVEAMRAVLWYSGERVAADPGNRQGRAYADALMCRYSIERACRGVLERFGRVSGPRPFAMDAEVGRRIEELTIYLRQNHAERDQCEIVDGLAQRQSAWT